MLKYYLIATIFHINCLTFTLCLLLVEEVESDAVLPPLHHVVVEGGRVPAVAALPLISLFAQRGQRFPQAVPGRGARAAVDGLVGVGGGVE